MSQLRLSEVKQGAQRHTATDIRAATRAQACWMPEPAVLTVLNPAFVWPALSCLVPSDIRFICWRGVTGPGGWGTEGEQRVCLPGGQSCVQLWGGQGSGQVRTVGSGLFVGSKTFGLSAGEDAQTPVLRLSPHGRGRWVKEEKVGPFYILPPALPTHLHPSGAVRLPWTRPGYHSRMAI